MRPKRWPVAWLGAVLVIGCATAPSPAVPRAATQVPSSAVTPPVAVVPAIDAVADDYRLQSGDVLEIKFFYNPELNERLPIRPDGKISLALVGEIEAEGRSASALQSDLVERYAASLRNPEVAVIVKELSGMQFFVGGEVRSAGLVRTSDELTLLQAIVQAGGFLNSAQKRNVVILRDQGTSEPLFLTVDLTGDLRGTALGSDLRLQPDDIVYVPKTRIARVDQFVDQYIKQVIPVALSLGVSYLHGDTVRFAQ